MTKDQIKMQEITEAVTKATIEFRKTLDRITRQLDEWEAEDVAKEAGENTGEKHCGIDFPPCNYIIEASCKHHQVCEYGRKRKEAKDD